MEELKLYTVEEVAEILKFSTFTIYKLVKSGELKAVKLTGGRRWRVTDAHLREYLENNLVEKAGGDNDIGISDENS